jgi:hypothetical protein
MSFALRLPVTPEEEALDPSIPLRTGGGNPAGALPVGAEKDRDLEVDDMLASFPHWVLQRGIVKTGLNV